MRWRPLIALLWWCVTQKRLARTALTHAADDTTAAFMNSVTYYLSTIIAGVAGSRLQVEPSGGHGFALCESLEICGWPAQSVKWLQDLGFVASSE